MIDNVDGVLLIEYVEVMISWILFCNGFSEYVINGEGCWFFDV